MRLLAVGLVLLFIVGCKPKEKKIVDYNGKYVEYIERNEIWLEGDIKISLTIENGAKVVYLIRHAEKDTVPKGNPILTKDGYDRSYRLAEIFKKTRLDAIYSTLYNRTMHTVDSLCNAKGLPTKIYQPKNLRQLGNDISSSKELNKVMIAGHSNTTPAMANVLMDYKILDKGFPESDYDNLLVVNMLPDGQKKLYQLRFK
ncbi:MAG: histidine phosphatase family protein [Bacteroidota bacterium]